MFYAMGSTPCFPPCFMQWAPLHVFLHVLCNVLRRWDPLFTKGSFIFDNNLVVEIRLDVEKSIFQLGSVVNNVSGEKRFNDKSEW